MGLYHQLGASFLPRLWHVPGATLAALIALITINSQVPYLQDYSEWVYHAWLVSELVGAGVTDGSITIAPFPVPNATLFIILMNGIALVTGWAIAAKVYMVLYIIAFVFVLKRLIVHWRVKHRWQALVIGTVIMVFSFGYWGGFISYQLSLLIFIAFLSGYSKTSKWWYIAAWSVLAFFAHAVGAFLVVAFTASHIAYLKYPKLHLRALAPVGSLIVWYMICRYTNSVEVGGAVQVQFDGLVDYLGWKGYMLARSAPFHTFLLRDGTSVFEDQNWLHYFGFGANLLFMALSLIGAFLLMMGRPVDRWISGSGLKRSRAPVTTLRIFMISVVILHFVLPRDFFGLQQPGLRLFIPALTLCLIASPARKALHNGLAALCVVLFSITMMNYHCAITIQETRDQVRKAHATLDIEKHQSRQSPFTMTNHKYFNHIIFGLDQRWEHINDREHVPIYFTTGPLMQKVVTEKASD